MTEELFRQDAYLRTCEALVREVNERDGIVLDRTVFYPLGGGQPGDKGEFVTPDGKTIEIATCVYGDARELVHVPTQGSGLKPGDKVTAKLDWETRYARMRIHTCLHLLSVVLPYPVTGGQVSEATGRLDFDISEAGLDKQAITDELEALIADDHPVNIEWITEAELDAKPELVKTMSVQPPRGSGRIRLIRIGTCDLQPCGGTHVAQTSEIGKVAVTKIEKKGAQNRRVRIALQ